MAVALDRRGILCYISRAMISIILVHTFAPHPDEHYTSLPAEEGQPASHVRRIVLEASPEEALDLAPEYLQEGEVVANTYELPAGEGDA